MSGLTRRLAIAWLVLVLACLIGRWRFESWTNNSTSAGWGSPAEVGSAQPESRTASAARRHSAWRYAVASEVSAQAGGPLPLPRRAVKEEVIVRLTAGARVEDLAARYGAEVAGSLTNLNTHRLRFTDELAAENARGDLLADPEVASVDLNYSIQRPAAAEPLGPSVGSALSLNVTPGDSGGSTIVGLVDTAVQAEAAGISGFVLDTVSVATSVPVADAELSHGTTMAETILQGLAKVLGEQGNSSTRILPVDVYGSEESTTTFQVAEGVLKAVEAGATVINLSLGSEEASSAGLEQVIQDAHAQGIIFLGAAGNTPATTATYPAAYPEVIAVTAVDEVGNLASYANRGSFVDVATPGTVVVTFAGQAYLINGTSAATALASGIVAGVLEARNLTPAQTEELIRSNLAWQTNN